MRWIALFAVLILFTGIFVSAQDHDDSDHVDNSPPDDNYDPAIDPCPDCGTGSTATYNDDHGTDDHTDDYGHDDSDHDDYGHDDEHGDDHDTPVDNVPPEEPVIVEPEEPELVVINPFDRPGHPCGTSHDENCNPWVHWDDPEWQDMACVEGKIADCDPRTKDESVARSGHPCGTTHDNDCDASVSWVDPDWIDIGCSAGYIDEECNAPRPGQDNSGGSGSIGTQDGDGEGDSDGTGEDEEGPVDPDWYENINCGNGVLEPELGENCEFGVAFCDSPFGSETQYVCSYPSCTCQESNYAAGTRIDIYEIDDDYVPECGNEIIESNDELDIEEECDNGALNSDSSDCSLDCKVNFCGDGVLNTEGLFVEQCEVNLACGDSSQFCNNSCECQTVGCPLISECGEGYYWNDDTDVCGCVPEEADEEAELEDFLEAIAEVEVGEISNITYKGEKGTVQRGSSGGNSYFTVTPNIVDANVVDVSQSETPQVSVVIDETGTAGEVIITITIKYLERNPERYSENAGVFIKEIFDDAQRTSRGRTSKSWDEGKVSSISAGLSEGLAVGRGIFNYGEVI